MKAADFFCGRGGWTHGLLAAGFDVDGYDIEPQPEYPGRFHQADVLELDPADFKGLDVATFSPPCEGFSLASPKVHRGERPTEEDLQLARWPLEFVKVAKPTWWVVENVRGAVKHFEPIYGKPALRYGAFYLWGVIPPFIVERSNAPLKFGGNTWRTNGVKTGTVRPAAVAATVPSELSRPMAYAIRNNLEAEHE